MVVMIVLVGDIVVIIVLGVVVVLGVAVLVRTIVLVLLKRLGVVVVLLRCPPSLFRYLKSWCFFVIKRLGVLCLH